MSVVAVKEYKDKIVLGCDSQITNGDNKFGGDQVSVSKIFSHNGMSIGGVGYVKDVGLMQSFSKNHKPKSCNIDAVLEFMVEFVDWCKKKDSRYQINCNLIIVMNNKMFRVNGGFNVSIIKDFWAIGSGAFLALGALELDVDVRSAIKIATKYDLYCSQPVKIIEVKK